MRAFRKISAYALALFIAVSIAVPVYASGTGFANFEYSNKYNAGQYRDIAGDEWFARHVEDACNYGLVQGKSADYFDPYGELTLGEAVTLAARLSSIYHTGTADFPESEPYYLAYADYALENGLINSHGDYSAITTRARFAELIYNALPIEAFPEINTIRDCEICDVPSDAAFSQAVYTLYRAGVFSGADRYGSFMPYSAVTRAEVCAIMLRSVNPAFRVKFALPGRLPASEIFQRSCDAVFMLETFDIDGKSIRTGSGFFISSDGLAVTNQHVLEGAASATITLYNGDVYPVRGICAYDAALNLAVFAIDAYHSRWSYLDFADSDLIEEGNQVYAIGSPWELINTITDGIISSKLRDVNGEALIQFTAPISFGSGGSPLLDSLGRVVGITSSSFSYGQNLNLAVPINNMRDIEFFEFRTLESFLQH